MGTPDFAVPTLKKLIEKHDVLAVVTQPDKPKGRGKKMLASPVKDVALEAGIEVFQPIKIKDDEECLLALEKFNADIFVVVAYGQILSERILKMPKFGCVNVHASLLPKYRGAAPIQRAVIDGEKVSGVTIMFMEKGLDTGDMIIKREVAIDDEETYGSLHDKIAPIGAEALIDALTLIEKGEAKPEKQNDELSCYAKKIERELEKIDWTKSSEKILNLIRGLNPIPGAYSFLNGEIFKIWKATEFSEKSYDGVSGEIVEIFNKKGFVVKTANSAVLVTEVQAKGGKKMACSDYMRGHSIVAGTILQ